MQHAPYLLGSAPLYAHFSLFGVVGNYTYQEFNTLPPRTGCPVLMAQATHHRQTSTFRPRIT